MRPLPACLLLSLLGCRSPVPRGPAAATDSVVLLSGVTAARLPDSASPGARLVARYCSECHAIPSPASHSAADWEPTLRRMVVYMERPHRMSGMGRMMRRGMGGPMRMSHGAVPTEDERRTLLAYLRAHSLRAIAPDSVPQARLAGATLFVRTCSRCHALPDPAQHPPAAWPAVVARMRDHMRRFQVDTISEATAGEVLRYLQSAAAGRGQAPAP